MKNASTTQIGLYGRKWTRSRNMGASSHPTTVNALLPRPHRFTLVEVMIVVAIIGLLATLVLPSLGKARMSAQNSRFAADLRTAAGAFEQFAIIEGGWPGDKKPAEMPNGMEDYLDGMDWRGTTSIGGQWDWDFGVFHYTAGVSVKSPHRTDEEMAVIDDMIDDGDLETGSFQARPDGYVQILQP